MPHYGLLHNQRLIDETEEIRGAKVYGVDDDKLGKIHDVIFDHATGTIRYVVVDTGGWLKTKEFVVPANRLRLSAKHKDDFEADLTKEQIESFPPYHEGDLASESAWGDYEDRYRSKWETGPVMHRTETDRNITPTTQQLQGNSSSMRASGGLPPLTSTGRILNEETVDAANAPTERIVRAGTDSVTIDNSAVGIGGRWDTFQARLRERRKEAVAGCSTCGVGSASVKGSESVDTLKKAI